MNARPRLVLLALASAAGLSGCSCNDPAPRATADGGAATRKDGGEVVLNAPDGGGGTVNPGLPASTITPGQFDAPGNTLDGVGQSDAGWVVLDQTTTRSAFAWLANPGGSGAQAQAAANPSTLSKIDTATGKEVARYFAVIPVDGKGVVHSLRYDTIQAYTSPISGGTAWYGHAASRTIVDLNGDVWLANRAFGGLGSVTKVANAVADCVDRNGNGVIDTSSDKNGDGVIGPGEMIVPPNPADPKGYDECVLFTTPIGTAAQPTVPRAITIDSGGMEGGLGSVWVGLWCGMSGTAGWDGTCLESSAYYTKGGAFVRLSPETGELLEVSPGQKHVDIGLRPYGAVVDRKNRLWAGTYARTRVAGVNVSTGAAIPVVNAPDPEAGSYGMALQETADGKTRLWFAGINRVNQVTRYDVDGDPATAWRLYTFTADLPLVPAGPNGPATPETFGTVRGVAVDDKGIVWLSAYIDAPTAPTLGACLDSVGNRFIVKLVGLDSETGKPHLFPDGHAVVEISRHYANLGQPPPCNGLGVGMDYDNQVWVASGNGYATAVDRATGLVVVRSPDVGDLYTYSDFTGYALRTFTAAQGTFETVLTGCASGVTRWLALDWVATVPANTTLQARVRSAASKAELSTPGQQQGPFDKSPADLAAAGVPDNPLLQVEFRLVSKDLKSSPALKSVTATYTCVGNDPN